MKPHASVAAAPPAHGDSRWKTAAKATSEAPELPPAEAIPPAKRARPNPGEATKAEKPPSQLEEGEVVMLDEDNMLSEPEALAEVLPEGGDGFVAEEEVIFFETGEWNQTVPFSLFGFRV